MKWSVGMKIGSGFGLALAMLVIIGSAAYVSIAKLTDTEGWVDHTYQVQNGLISVTKALVDAETGQRGYIITGQESYLDPYHSGLASVDQTLAQVRKLTSDNPSQQKRMD